MANDFNPKHSIENTISIIVILVVICSTVVIIMPGILPGIPKSLPTATRLEATRSGGEQAEIIPPPTYTPDQASHPKSIPKSAPPPTLIQTSTSTPIHEPLPDLTVTSISDPVCASEYDGAKIRFIIHIRNIGRVRTGPFGPFDVGVFLILGERRYSLDEWGTLFNGVVGSSVTRVFNLNPNEDVKFTVVIDLKGNRRFGIEATVNSGSKPIQEATRTNNTLIKSFVMYCW